MTSLPSALDGADPATVRPDRGAAIPVWMVMSIYLTVVVAFSVVAGIRATDYVGGDNDDAMRLVQVRDFLAGQNWFDMVQYRLGPPGGTLMHWSRLVDLPIAALMSGFGLFLTGEAREAAALFVWPILLTAPVVFSVGYACLRMGGLQTMHLGLAFITMSLISNNRFQPGNIDHHNVQIALVAVMVAGLLAPLGRGRGHALAGIMAGLAIAVGVETTPLVAVVCLLVSLRWAWHGLEMRAAAMAFGLALAATVTSAFLLTTPPRLYAMVTCDNLSLGFASLAATGGAALVLAASLASGRPPVARLLALAVAGIAVGTVLLTVAPQCLSNPLNTLDPLLKTLWLDQVQEARSFFQMAREAPSYLGFSYAVGALAVIVCSVRLWRGERRELHLVLLALCLPALLIAMFQVRGTMFSNFLAIFPLAMAASDLRTFAHREPGRTSAELGFAAFVLLSLPSVWAVGTIGVSKVLGVKETALTTTTVSLCNTQAAFAPLNEEPAGLVTAPSNLGAPMLRFTSQRVLAGPYHRNQAGMLAEMRIGLAPADEAERLIRENGVTLLAFCAEDAEAQSLAEIAPDGLYAMLAKGAVPAYLQPVERTIGQPLRIFRIAPAS